MRGREYFKKYKAMIRLLEHCISPFPDCFKQALWTATCSWTGKTGLLVRYVIARCSAASCGEIVYIGPYVEIRSWTNLRVGSNVSIHRGCYIDAQGKVSIGDDVSVAHNSSIISFDHQWHDQTLTIRDNPFKFSPVNIKNDVWIGCGTRILSGVTIESRSVVAAGSVVVNDVASGSLVGGIPAHLIKNI